MTGAAVTVMGAGAWGTTLAKVMVEAGTEVLLWTREAEVAEEINGLQCNTRYLPGIELPAGIRATADPVEALTGAATVVLAVPAQVLRGSLESWAPLLTDTRATMVSLAKGIELGTLMRMSQVITSVSGVQADQVAVLSGPNLAREIAEGEMAATVIACSDSARAVAVQRALATGYFRPYTNTDVIGTEIGGACKNVIALACGMAAGSGMGENTAAAIITRGLAEITRLAVALGAKAETLAGLAGVGDLVATCTSPQSRNRSFGERLGRGASVAAARADSPTLVEGVMSSESVLALATSYDVEMPLTDAVYQVCHRELAVDAAMAQLLGRRTKSE